MPGFMLDTQDPKTWESPGQDDESCCRELLPGPSGGAALSHHLPLSANALSGHPGVCWELAGHLTLKSFTLQRSGIPILKHFSSFGFAQDTDVG